jgi:Transposase DNA-binding/Transposase Tn5 dimerisation domain
MGEVSWAEEEFGEAELNDPRRTARLVALAQAAGARPGASLPEACEDGAALKAAYRFFDTDEIEPSSMLASHVEATTRRLRGEAVVLAVQDTTSLDYSGHPATTGLGVLNDAKHHGLLVHTTLVTTPERVPLGLLAQDVWTRDVAVLGKRATRKARPIAEKESRKWLTSLEAVVAAHARCPETRFISVGDREADVYDLFVAERPVGVDLLIRASWDRGVEGPHGHLWAAVAAAPEAGHLTVTVPPRAARVGTPAQPARTAHLTLHFAPVTLRPPRHRAAEPLPAVPVAAVRVVEAAPPDGARPVEWLLLTTLPVTTADEAFEIVGHYVCRWDIEVWHKVLKSGCRIEARQLETADRLRRCLTLYSVVAWRVLYATLLARAAPDLPCTALLDDDEWQALCCIIRRTASPPPAPPPLRQAVRWIAQLGGFLARASDGEPGPIVLWRGFQHLADHTAMFRIMRPSTPSRLVGNR